MAIPDKEMEIADFKSFLGQQFPNSIEVNILFDQIVASKNAMEEAFGDKIPSFYGTMARIITVNTRNGISDWVNSDGQVNITQINKAAQKVRDVYEQKREEEKREEHNRQKKEQYINEIEDEDLKEFYNKIGKIDWNNIQFEDWMVVAENPQIFLSAPDEIVSKETKKNFVEITEQLAGAEEIYTVLTKIAYKLVSGENPEILEKLKDNDIANIFMDENGQLNQEEIRELFGKKVSAMREIYLLGKSATRERIQEILERNEIDLEKYPGFIDIDKMLELSHDPKKFKEVLEKASEVKDNFEKADSETSTPQRQQKDDKYISATKNTGSSGISQDQKEMFFDDLFAGAADFAEMTEEMGEPTLEGDGYATFFEPSKQELEFQQMQAEQDMDELGGDQMQSDYELGDDGVLGGETEQDGVDSRTAQSKMEEELGDSLEPEEPARAGATAGFNIVNQLQNAAKEEPNDYTQGGDGEYQSPTLDNLDDNKQGGIRGLWAGIKKFVQDRFVKKPEQKRLNPSSEQRTDENGWTVTTYDGQGKDLMPRGTGFRNAMVRFAENTIGRLGKLAVSNKSSSEPINTPYVIPSNVQSKARDITRDEANPWVVKQSELTDMQHSVQNRNVTQKGDGER